MKRPTNTEQHESGMFYNKMKDRQHLYALNREDLATVENELLKLVRNTNLSVGQRKAIVSASASMITLIDIVNLLGVGEGISSGGVGVNGCLPLKNSQKIENLDMYYNGYTGEIDRPEKFSENSECIHKKLTDMLQFLSSVTLTDEEWLDSYDLYVKHRVSLKRKECGQHQSGS